MTCDDVRQRIHDAYDGEPAGALPDAARAHIASCSACHELYVDLAALTRMLRERPQVPLPSDALDAVWRDTVRARPLRFGKLAAAAMFAIAVTSTTLFFLVAPKAPPQPTPVELARATAQAELVLGYTARALDATRTAATDRVLASKVSPAVRGVATKTSRR